MSKKADAKVHKIVLQNKDVWKTEAEFFSWVRGGIRGGLWNRHPVKLKFLNKNRIRIPNPNPRGRVTEVWGGKCSLCNNLFVIKEMQVDHIAGGAYSIKTIDDVQAFFEGIILVTEDDLRFLCKGCNSTCTYAARNNISYEEAFCTKYIIKLIKEKQLDLFFSARNLPIPKNKPLARSKAIEILLKEVKNV